MRKHQWTLGELLKAAGVQASIIDPQRKVSALTDSSRTVEPGSLFVATRGVRTDSHAFISDAVERGAAAVVVEKDIPAYPGVEIVHVPDSREALGLLAHAWYNHPTRNMLVFGVSGTNGKTTSTYLLESILKACGYSPGVVGTIEHRFAGQVVKAANTTPTALQLAEIFSEMKSAGVNAVAMEVSSHAADQARIAGVEFNVGILTNITQDHLDYHGTMEAYAGAKRKFYFDYLLRGDKKPGGAAFNLDDDWGRDFYNAFPGNKIGFSTTLTTDLCATDIRLDAGATRFSVDGRIAPQQVVSPLLGMFNVYNVLGALSAAILAELPMDAVLQGIASLSSVPGRFEYVTGGQDFVVIVDYAHTPDALERVLTNARHLAKGQIITVFGCGGDRDPGKRPLMGQVAGSMSDHVILTNDNPRTEDPARIAEMAFEGVRKSGLDTTRAQIILDRREAIGAAISMAKPGDLVIIAGKGHEDYQILGQNVVHFDDREVAREFLAAAK